MVHRNTYLCLTIKRINKNKTEIIKDEQKPLSAVSLMQMDSIHLTFKFEGIS